MQSEHGALAEDLAKSSVQQQKADQHTHDYTYLYILTSLFSAFLYKALHIYKYTYIFVSTWSHYN